MLMIQIIISRIQFTNLIKNIDYKWDLLKMNLLKDFI